MSAPASRRMVNTSSKSSSAATGFATAFCYAGLGVFSALFFSKSIINDDNSYGPVGVVMVLVTYFIAIGMVVHLGAVFGRMWNERHTTADQKTSVTPE
jgi:membrane protein